MTKTKVAIVGSGNIGTDLMFKVVRLSSVLEMAVMVGIDPASDGLARAARLGIEVTSDGVEGLLRSRQFDDIGLVFDATSAHAHRDNAARLAPSGTRIVDLTPAAIGPFVVPAVNVAAHEHARNVNMVTCGGQATIPVVAAVSDVTPVHYAEIVASISANSAGPGTRANIDEFTETTAAALEQVGRAGRGKAIIVLNPADPPMIMRDTVELLTDRLDDAARERVEEAVRRRVDAVTAYVPGYALSKPVQFSDAGAECDALLSPTAPDDVRTGAYTRVTVLLRVEGAAMYLPEYAGNLDIMTSAALRTAEHLVLAGGPK